MGKYLKGILGSFNDLIGTVICRELTTCEAVPRKAKKTVAATPQCVQGYDP
jgi:hypothetical protein